MTTHIRLLVAVAALATVKILTLSAATLYVSLESTNPIPPFATWATAATNIQQAVDAAKGADTVLVTNGVYAAGERDVWFLDTDYELPQVRSRGPSRVVITNSIRLESVNGPLVTTVEGNQRTEEYGLTNGVRCVYLGGNAVLSGFTLTNGFGWDQGGGVFCERFGVVTNCTLTGNWVIFGGGGAFGGTLYNCILTGNGTGGGTPPFGGGGARSCTLYNCTVVSNKHDGAHTCTLYNCTLTGNSAPDGGGAFGSTLYNCTLTDNSAGVDGGGATHSALYNCTLTGNAAENGGGGAAESTLYNCIVYFNTAPNGPNYLDCTFQYSCTTPVPTNGIGNISGPPLFMDITAGDLRLREDSPCIDAGANLVGFTMTTTNASTGDVFALAYPHDATDILGNTRFIDGNGDGKVAWDIGAYEFNSFKPPRFSIAPQLTPDGWQLSVTGAPSKWVHLQRSANLKDWEDIWSGFMGADGVQQVNDGDTGPKAMFYRVVVP